MTTRNITIRVPIDEFDMINELATHHKMNRTSLIRKAIQDFGKVQPPPPPPPPTITEATRKVEKVMRRKIDIADFRHPLLDRINRDGVAIYNKDMTENSIIHNLTELLDFIDKKVLVKK